MFGIDPREYDLKVALSSNEYSSVYLAQYLPNGLHVAVKKYKMDVTNYEMVHLEVSTMRQLNHPNIHSLLACFMHGNDLYLVSKIMCFGSCKDTIRNCFNAGELQ